MRSISGDSSQASVGVVVGYFCVLPDMGVGVRVFLWWDERCDG